MENAKVFLSRFVPKISIGQDPLTDFSLSLIHICITGKVDSTNILKREVVNDSLMMKMGQSPFP